MKPRAIIKQNKNRAMIRVGTRKMNYLTMQKDIQSLSISKSSIEPFFDEAVTFYSISPHKIWALKTQIQKRILINQVLAVLSLGSALISSSRFFSATQNLIQFTSHQLWSPRRGDGSFVRSIQYCLRSAAILVACIPVIRTSGVFTFSLNKAWKWLGL